jgi:predicted transcriptional regulator
MSADVTETELGVLQVIWELGPCTIRQIADRLYPGGTASHYATVQKLLERLEEKRGMVVRDRSVTPHLYSATRSREGFIGGHVRAMAERLCGGSLTPLLTHLLKTESLSATERKELRRLLEPPTDAK